jgi:oligosaccharide repeat unit polymerase
MTTYNPNPEDAKKLFIIVNYFILFFACGFILNGKIVFSNINRKKINFKYCYYFFYICILYLSIKLCNDIILTIKGGYQALYIQGNNAGVFSGTLVRIAKLILLITFLIIINDTEPKKCNKYFIIFIVFSLLTGFVGSRGTLVTYILTIFYLYNRKNNKKLNILMFSSCVLGVFILMNVILGFSSRGGQDSDFILNTSVITGFLNSQGVSLSVIGYSLYGINEYPLHTLLQSVIPLFFKIYSLFNSDVEMYTSSITTYIAYNANYHMFLQGAGLGSSIVSELFLLVNYELLIFIICSVFFGFIIGFVEKKSINSSYCFILIGTMMPFILFSPRDGLNVLIISTIYCLLIIVLFRMKIKKKV